MRRYKRRARAGMNSMQATPPREHYSGFSITLHWLTVALIVLGWCLGQFHEWVPKGPARATAMFIHNSAGLAVIVLLALRLAARFTASSPVSETQPLGRFGDTAARIGHAILYVLLLLVPISGIVLQFARGAPLSIFGLFEIASPWIRDRAFSRSVREVHEFLSNALLIFAFLHAVAALTHHYWFGDNTLRRMIPSLRSLR